MKRFFCVLILALLPVLWCGATPTNSADDVQAYRRSARASAEVPADEPIIVVKSPKETVAGKLVKLDASQSTVDSLEWHLVDGPAEDFDVAADGRRATFSNPRPGIYFFAVSGAKLVDGKAVARGAVVKVTLIDDPEKPQPPVVPPVGPPVTPPPVTPTGLASWVTSVASGINDSERAKNAKAIAKAYQLWARGAGAQTRDAQTFVAGSNMVLDLLLSQAKLTTTWKPFRDALEARLATLGLTTVAQHVAAWEEIAQGLEAVK